MPSSFTKGYISKEITIAVKIIYFYMQYNSIHIRTCMQCMAHIAFQPDVDFLLSSGAHESLKISKLKNT